jgi:hypothetical protein
VNPFLIPAFISRARGERGSLSKRVQARVIHLTRNDEWHARRARHVRCRASNPARSCDAFPAIDAIGAWQARDARRSFRGIAAFSRACFALLGAMADRLGIA